MKLQLCVGALASSAEPSTRAATRRGARLAASLSAHTHVPLPIPQHVSHRRGCSVPPGPPDLSGKLSLFLFASLRPSSAFPVLCNRFVKESRNSQGIL